MFPYLWERDQVAWACVRIVVQEDLVPGTTNWDLMKTTTDSRQILTRIERIRLMVRKSQRVDEGFWDTRVPRSMAAFCGLASANPQIEF